MRGVFHGMLQTKRLILRSPTLNDADRIEELASDYDIAKTTLNIPHPYPKGSAVEFINHVLDKEKEGTIKIYAVIKKELDALIGLINININPAHEHGELGYWIGKPYWGNGYGTEAARAVVDFGFTHLNLHKIFARASAQNPGSWRIMEKLGMIYEGEQRQHYIRFGKYIDIVCYGILKTEYEMRKIEDTF